MGYGAFMKVINNRSTAIKTYVTNINCMYDQGKEGSNLSLFNNALINPHTSLPNDGGHGQYIEANADGTCFFSDSTFTLKIEIAENEIIIGQVDFTDSKEKWKCKDSNVDVIDVYINNSGKQALIQVTVEET
jgi:hypothetical protein